MRFQLQWENIAWLIGSHLEHKRAHHLKFFRPSEIVAAIRLRFE